VALFYCGVDLGQAADYTAVCLVEVPLWCGPEVDFDGWGVFIPPEIEGSGWVAPSRLSPRTARQVEQINFELGRPPHPPLNLVHLERYELGTSYPEVISRVTRLLKRFPISEHPNHTRLLIDATGVGRPVVDSFRAQGVYPIGITIHGGDRVSEEIGGPRELTLRVPKRDLVSAVQTLLQNNRLRIAAGLPLADVLRRELLNFKMRIDPRTAHDSYSHWREGDHDDLVLATACAAWFREHESRPVELRNQRQGGYRVPEFVEYKGTEEFSKGEPEPFFTGQPKPSGPNPWHGLTGG
jgi:hypothetical protein